MQMIRRVDLDRVQFHLGQQRLVIRKTAGGRQSGEVAEPVAVGFVRISHGADFQQRRVVAAEVKILVDFPHHRAGADDAQTKFVFHNPTQLKTRARRAPG